MSIEVGILQIEDNFRKWGSFPSNSAVTLQQILSCFSLRPRETGWQNDGVVAYRQSTSLFWCRQVVRNPKVFSKVRSVWWNIIALLYLFPRRKAGRDPKVCVNVGDVACSKRPSSYLGATKTCFSQITSNKIYVDKYAVVENNVREVCAYKFDVRKTGIAKVITNTAFYFWYYAFSRFSHAK